MGFRGKNKFFAHKVEYNGIKFDSTLERDRYIFLSNLEKEGHQDHPRKGGYKDLVGEK